jgi:tRNA pseudouridine55 synthase
MAGVHGIVLLDKPLGLSSSQALTRARRSLDADKGGHTGSLDPLATGMLPCCFGEATKIAGLLLGSRKAYRAEVALGASTATGDREGAVLDAGTVPALDAASIEAALAPLRGHIRQRPPAYSAIKQGGVPLYRLARRGEAVEAPEREVWIEQLEWLPQASRTGITPWSPPGGPEALLSRPPDHDAVEFPLLTIEVTCGSGTYIRSLAADLGKALGCGAHLASLRRLWVEPFEGAATHTLEALQAAATAQPPALDGILLPIAAGLAHWRRIDLDAEGERRLRCGQTAALAADQAPGECRVHGPDGRLLALARVEAGAILRSTRVFAPGL